MSCRAAMLPLEDVVTAKSDMTVNEISHLLEGSNLRAVPVVDDNNVLLGMFSTRIFLRNLLPSSVTMEDGLQRLSFGRGAESSLVKLLVQIKEDPIIEHIEQNPVVLHPDTAMWEVVRLLVVNGSPLAVVEKDTGKLAGLISDQSILELLNQSVDAASKGDSKQS